MSISSLCKRTLRLGILVVFAFLGGAVATAYGAFGLLVPQNVAFGGPTGAAAPHQSPYAFLQQLARVLVLIEAEYVEPVDRARLLEGSIKGLVSELDPHSAYLPREDFRIFQSDTKGEFGGIGVEVDFQDDAVTVIAPIEGSPAEKAGVKPGDRIIAIDNVAIRGRSTQDLIRTMRGTPGTRVLLTVRRPGSDKLLYFNVVREVIEVSSVARKALKGNIAYLRIKQFQSGTSAELLEAIGKLREELGEVKGVLLDLRNNPGGLVDEATAVADEFLGQGIVYTTRHRGKVVDEVRARRGGALSREPLVVLVNEYSASAAELLSGALQDHKRATVVGTPTFGKGSVQTIIDLPDGSGLRLTTMRYYTPNGHAIQAQGIKPDVLVEAAYVADKSFGVMKEADLENHLPAEGSPDAPATPKPRSAPSEEAPTHLGVAQKVPDDPTGGSDFALSIGYQIVRGVLPR